MKLLELYLESINIPFKNKCKITIKNIKGKKIIVDCEIPTTEEEKMQEDIGGTLGGQASEMRQAEMELAAKKAQEDQMIRDYYSDKGSLMDDRYFKALRNLGRG